MRFLQILSRSRFTAFSHVRGYSTPIAYSEEVLEAKSAGKPLVALESTIITHGMPYPKNLETAREVENIIRERGAVPATIAILKGQLTVGLTPDQLTYLAQAKGVIKASRRDLAPLVASQLDGATTVAGTIIAAELAGIPVFVTGGIGGVHREGEKTLDVSADLNELGRSRTLVVCSGVKSILDIGRTLEYLETQGVCVCAFGNSGDFPAFYTLRSGHRAPYTVPNAQEAARVLHTSRIQLQLSSGILVAVPVPQEYAMDDTVIESAIKSALEDADKKGIRGKEVTPFILSAVMEATGGYSLDTNIALIKNNAKVGADIAVEFKKIRNADNLVNNSNIGDPKGAGLVTSSRRFHSSCKYFRGTSREGDRTLPGGSNAPGNVLIIGGANVDRTYRVTEQKIQLDGSTHSCVTEQCGGGVGRNVAEALWRLSGGRARLLTALGDDDDGRYLANIAPGLLLDGCVVNGARTPSYAAVFDANGECSLGLGDMELHNHITVDLVDKHMTTLKDAPMIVLDGNLPQETINYVVGLCNQLHKPVFFEPTDRRKAVKILQTGQQIEYASPNLLELQAMAQFIKPSLVQNQALFELNEIIELAKSVRNYIKCLIITLGPKGVIYIEHLDGYKSKVNFYPSEKIDKIKNVSGAGDCFTGGFLHGLLSGHSVAECIFIGSESAKAALHSRTTVPISLNVNSVENAKFVLI